MGKVRGNNSRLIMYRVSKEAMPLKSSHESLKNEKAFKENRNQADTL